jgi:hypothetical protein
MKFGRNDPCPCGSGLKYKKCHLIKQQELEAAANFEWDKWFAQDQTVGQANLAVVQAREEKLRGETKKD